MEKDPNTQTKTSGDEYAQHTRGTCMEGKSQLGHLPDIQDDNQCLKWAKKGCSPSRESGATQIPRLVVVGVEAWPREDLPSKAHHAPLPETRRLLFQDENQVE